MLALVLLLSQKQDPSRNESYNLIKMCKCVGIFLVKGGWTPLHDPSLFFIFHWCGLSFSFFSFWHALWACGIPSLGMHLSFFIFFFLTCLLSMWHTFFGYAFLFPFCIGHILDGHFREKESWYVMEFYFVSGWECLLFVSGRVRDLDHEKMTRLYQGSKNLTKLKAKSNCIWRFEHEKSNFGFGRNFH